MPCAYRPPILSSIIEPDCGAHSGSGRRMFMETFLPKRRRRADALIKGCSRLIFRKMSSGQRCLEGNSTRSGGWCISFRNPFSLPVIKRPVETLDAAVRARQRSALKLSAPVTSSATKIILRRLRFIATANFASINKTGMRAASYKSKFLRWMLTITLS